MNAERGSRLQLVECARGLAAFSVVIFHANATSQLEGWVNFPWLTIFQYGVDFFFVLSGYIIFFAHRKDFGQRAALSNYLARRAVRLLPTLWLVIALILGLRLLTSMPVDLPQLVRSAFPYPSLLPTTPAVVWTLRHEFIFYAMVALLIYSQRLGMLLATVWIAACILQLGLMLFDRQITGVASFFVSSYSLDFFIGMFIGHLHRRHEFKVSWRPLLVGFGALAAALFLDLVFGFHRHGPTDYVTTQAGWFTLSLGLSFGLILHGLLVLEGRVKAPPSLVSLGGATYAIYLIHTPVNGAAVMALKRLGLEDRMAQGAGAALLVVLGTCAGIVLHHAFERPAGNWLRRQWDSSRSAGAPSRATGVTSH